MRLPPVSGQKYHWGGLKEKLVQGCIDAKKRGFTAIGHLTPFLDEPRSIP